MKDKKPTWQALKKAWWWRNPNPYWTFDESSTMTKPIEPEELLWGITIWKDGLESAAWSWELLRRSENVPKLDPFPELPNLFQMELWQLFGKAKSEVAWIETSSKIMEARPGYSLPSIWPLAMPDDALLKRFKSFIDEQRETFNLEKSGRARSSKGPAWRSVELLDLEHRGLREKYFLTLGQQSNGKDKESDRRTCKRAKATAKELWNKLAKTDLLRVYKIT